MPDPPEGGSTRAVDLAGCRVVVNVGRAGATASGSPARRTTAAALRVLSGVAAQAGAAVLVAIWKPGPVGSRFGHVEYN